VPAAAQDLKAFEKTVTDFTLANGLRFLVVERHDAPVVSFHTYVDAGSVDDPKGATGMAHMFEHMAFKGTEKIGSKNWADEKKALEAVDRAFDALRAERNKARQADKKKIEELDKAFKSAVEKAGELVETDEFSRIIEQSGGVGLNASTSADRTNYFYNLPSNRVELWFYLESERFLRPVYREFYKERDVVREERRMRTESNPVGKLVEVFLTTAFNAHPYGQPGVGWPDDVENFSIADADAFYRKYYVPSAMTIALVGDVDPKEMRRMAETYFARLPKRPVAPPVLTQEPEQPGERRLEVESQAQPVILVGYRKPSQYDKDRAVFDVIQSVLAGGRTSWLYKELVRDKQLALAAGGFPGFPGEKYPGMFLFYAFPNSGKTVAENEAAMYTLIEKLKTEKVDQETLDMVKTKNRAELIQKLERNAGLADLMAAYQGVFGDWRQLFHELDEINRVTADDVQRVAKQYFTKKNRTVGWLVQAGK